MSRDSKFTPLRYESETGEIYRGIEILCELYMMDDESPEEFDDLGRKMAASKELYEALQDLAAICRNGFIPPEDLDKHSPEEIWDSACGQFRLSRSLEEAEAALRKAEGKGE